MLEKVADTSLSSQLSLLQDCPQSLSSISVPHHHHQATETLEAHPVRTGWSNFCGGMSHNDAYDFELDGNLEPKSKILTTPEQATLYERSVERDCSDVPDEEGVVTVTDLNDTLKGSPSLAYKVEFDDNEEWESFNHGSPHLDDSMNRSESQNSPSSSRAHMTSWKSPVRREHCMGGNDDMRSSVRTYAEGRPGESVHAQCLKFDTAVRDTLDNSMAYSADPTDCRVKYLSCLEACGTVQRLPCEHDERNSLIASDKNACLTSFDEYSPVQTSEPQILNQYAPNYRHSDVPMQMSVPTVFKEPIPPPSALVSRLFPVLRRQENRNGRTSLAPLTYPDSSVTLPLSGSSENPNAVKTSSPESSTGGESGFRSHSSSSTIVSDELRQKLHQLEEEIARYRTENANLDRLRMEREEVRNVCDMACIFVTYACTCVAKLAIGIFR